jgi:hypothetical protein
MAIPSFLDKAVGRATHIPRQLGILPDRANDISGVKSILTGKKEKKRKTLLSKSSRGSSLT